MANTYPIYGYKPQVRAMVMRVGNQARDGSGAAVYPGFFGEAFGSRLDRISFFASQLSNSATSSAITILRIFVTDTNGQNPRLLKEINSAAATITATQCQAHQIYNIPGGMLLMQGQVVLFTTSSTANEPWTVVCEGVDFTAPITSTIYKRTVTVDNAQLGTALNDVNYPVLVSLVENDLKSVANGGKVQNSNGYDIKFYSDSNFTTLLNWEVANYDPATGTLRAWVSLPTIGIGTVNRFYMSYGDNTVTTFQGGATGSAWNSNYLAVYHMGQATGTNIVDSTANGRNGTVVNNPTQVDGMVGNGLNFDQVSSQYIDLGSGSFLDGLSKMTVSVWAKRNAASALLPVIYRSTGGVFTTPNGQRMLAYTNGSIYGCIDTGAYVFSNNATFNSTSFNAWAMVFDGSQASNITKLKFYANAQTVVMGNGGGTMGTTTQTLTGANLYIGRDQNDSPFYGNGAMDEIRITNNAMSADWLTAEYNNVLNPGTFTQQGPMGFLTFGNEY